MTPAPSPSRPAWRTARAIVGAVLVPVAILIPLLAVGLHRLIHGEFSPELFSLTGDWPRLGVLGFVVALVPAAVLVLALFKRWLARRTLGLGLVLTAVACGWLAWDERPGPRPALDQLWPAVAGDEQSYAVLMQYSKRSPSPEMNAFAAAKLSPWSAAQPGDPAKWREFVTAQRAAIEADWATLAPQRHWFAEVAAFDRLSDLTPPRSDADIITVQVWRALFQRGCAIATLQALDGRGDEALATLLPFVHVSRRLQPASRTLVRTMIGIAMEKMTLQTAAFILEHSTTSPASRAEFARALEPEQAPALARRLVLLEAPFVASTLDSMRSKAGDLIKHPFSALSPLLMNPSATENVYYAHMHRLAAYAEARDLEAFSRQATTFEASMARPRLKNILGCHLLRIIPPSFEKLLATHWQVFDLRAKLRQSLAA